MNKIKIYLLIIGSAGLFSACNEWLNLYPENAQTSDQYWETKEDVAAVIGAGYIKLRNCADYIFVWGEARGTGIDIHGINTDANAAGKIRQLDILPSNIYAKWSKFYEVINMANSVLAYAPDVKEKDPSFTEEEMNSYFSEAYFLRSLAYFYLVRTFGEVPLILFPSVKDMGSYDIRKSTEEEILFRLTADLNNALPSAKEFYPEINAEQPVNSKGRATKWSIYALLADIYLWQENYAACIEACDKVIGSGRVGLINGTNWYANFYPGNSNESIFEIQYDYGKNQTNSFIDWFGTTQRYAFSNYTYLLFQETEFLGDIRGYGASYITINRNIWKYLGLSVDVNGAAVRASGTQNDQNFIIYRLADVYLMKAEALIMTGNFEGATKIIAQIRSRAEIVEDLSERATEPEMLKLLLDERHRELFAEGKNWFDLLRFGKKDNYRYKNEMIEHILSVLPSGIAGIARSKLSDPNSHYLPVHQDEVNANKLLEQNPYYRSLGN